MKLNWQTKKLGEICEIVNGGTPDTKIARFWNGEYLWITPKDMGKNENIYVDDTARKITSDGLKNSSAKLLPINSLILSSRAPIGYLVINLKEISTNQGCKGIIPKKDLLTKYLYYFLKNSVELLNKLGSGTTFKELSGSKLSQIEISFPPLSEQQRIVKILDEAFEKIEKVKKNTEINLQNSKEIFKTYLKDIFDNTGDKWKEVVLGNLCEIVTKGTTPTSVGYNFVENGINFIKIESIDSSRKFLKNKFAAITEECHTALKRSQLKKNDILFSIAGALGRTALVSEDILPANTNQALSIIRLKSSEEVIPEFLLYALESGSIFDQISKFKGGVAQQNLSLEQVKSFQIHLPQITEQKEIVEKLDKISSETKKLELIYKQKLADLEELKKSILNKAFNGEL